MKLKKVWAVYFSGTGTTRRTVERIAGDIAARLGLPVQSVDFSRPALRQETLRFSDTDLVVFGTPVYAGRVPNVLLPFLQEKVVGGGALGLAVAVLLVFLAVWVLQRLQLVITEDMVQQSALLQFFVGQSPMDWFTSL